MVVTCTRCRRQLHEGDKVQYTGLTVYHELSKPIDAFQYAVDKPFCITGVRHLVCDQDGD